MSARCRPEWHYFAPFHPTTDLGGGAQKCECGAVLIDRTLGGGRVVEIDLKLQRAAAKGTPDG